MDYLAPLSNNLGYCLAVEKLLGLEVPKRAQYIRVLLTEMTRISFAPGLAGNARDRFGRDDRLPLLLPRARGNSADI